MLNRSVRAAQRGFTLLELMVVVAIVAILAALAISSYSCYIRKARYFCTMRRATMFSISVTAQGDQAKDAASGTACTTLTLNQAGARSPATCWAK